MIKEEDDAITTNRRRALMVAAASSHIQIMEEEESEWGGSSEGRKYVPRLREMMDQRLKSLTSLPHAGMNLISFAGATECNHGCLTG